MNPTIEPAPGNVRSAPSHSAASAQSPAVAPPGIEPEGAGSYGNNPACYSTGGALSDGRDKFRAALRRSWIIVLTGFVGLLAGLYVYRSSPPVFESRATIEIKRFKQDAAELSEDERVRLTGMGEIASIVEKFGMRKLYQAAAESHLFRDRRGLVPAKREYRLPWNLSQGGADNDGNAVADGGVVSSAALAGMMRGWVSVSWRENTTLIDLKARHTEPDVAKDTLQAVIEEYERLTDQSVEGSSKNTLKYIMDSAAEVKQALQDTETDLQRYMRGIELSADIENAQRKVLELEKRYLDRWPDLVEARKLVGILREEFSRELAQVLRLSPRENAIWAESEGDLKGLSPDELTDVRLRFVRTRSSVLQKDLESDRVLYDNLMTKLKEGQINQGHVAKHFELVDAPRLPGGPVAPDRAGLVRNGLAGGVAFGCCIVAGLGFLDRRVQSLRQLEALFPVPVIGAFPAMRQTPSPGSRPLVMADSEADDSEREPFRTLRASISLLDPESQPRTLLISSSLPSEGKSWLAANLAVAFAQKGERTVLIDADLRKPVQADIFGIGEDVPGLTDLIGGRHYSEAFHRAVPGLENLLVLPAGARCDNPSELLASNKVRDFLTNLPADRVIIDSAPLLPVADTLPLADASDCVFLVCHVGRTPMGAIEKAWQLLETNGNNTPRGLIANRLARRSKKGGYYSYEEGYRYGYGYGD